MTAFWKLGASACGPDLHANPRSPPSFSQATAQPSQWIEPSVTISLCFPFPCSFSLSVQLNGRTWAWYVCAESLGHTGRFLLCACFLSFGASLCSVEGHKSLVSFIWSGARGRRSGIYCACACIAVLVCTCARTFTCTCLREQIKVSEYLHICSQSFILNNEKCLNK